MIANQVREEKKEIQKQRQEESSLRYKRRKVSPYLNSKLNGIVGKPKNHTLVNGKIKKLKTLKAAPPKPQMLVTIEGDDIEPDSKPSKTDQSSTLNSRQRIPRKKRKMCVFQHPKNSMKNHLRNIDLAKLQKGRDEEMQRKYKSLGLDNRMVKYRIYQRKYY